MAYKYAKVDDEVQASAHLNSDSVPLYRMSPRRLHTLKTSLTMQLHDAERVSHRVPDPHRSERMIEGHVEQVRTSVTADGADVWPFSKSPEGTWLQNGMTCCLGEVFD